MIVRAFAMILIACLVTFSIAQEKAPLFTEVIDVEVPHISTDKSVKYDYDIVYVRAPRVGDEIHKRFYLDFSSPVVMEPGADLMLLHPDGSEELLVEGGEGSVTDPVISFDGQWCYYVHIHNLEKSNQWNPPREGADIFKIHLKSRKIVGMTNQKFTPNTGAAKWNPGARHDPANPHAKDKSYIEYGVYNMGPYPLPGGKIVFTSNRDAYKPANGYPAVALQLFVMDDRDESIGEDEMPTNLEKIGHLNISGALHPVVLKDGRIMFSSLESQGIRGEILWGLWTIHPDGSNWGPLVSAFDPGGAPNGFHFQTQLSDESIVFEMYYNQNNSGFGAYMKMPPKPPLSEAGALLPAFGPGYARDPRNEPWRMGRHNNGKGQWYSKGFMPTGSVAMTPFTTGREGPANPAVYYDKESPKVGKFTHPSGAPDNHMLTIYSPGPVNHQYTYLPQLDGGIYLMKKGEILEQPADMLLIKNDPKYNESWPRAVVSYERIFGVAEPKQLTPVTNDGKASPHLPEGTPFGLVGSSSMYKRESYPNGVVPEGEVTARCPEEIAAHDPWKGLDAFTSHGNGMPINWHNQGADAGLYSNDEIAAIRILFMEPTTDRQRGANSGLRFYSHAQERLRIAGEIPVRKFGDQRSAVSDQQKADSRKLTADSSEPLDPDGNPDTSFLAKIPADTAFTFQTIDKDGMVLNMSQTWHQLRPGEIRTNCGGCHAHSQAPTLFEDTLASKPDYKLWDLSKGTPLLTAKASDESKQQWMPKDDVGLKTVEDEIVNVEYFRDVKPILNRSCVACHDGTDGKKPAGNLDLNADHEEIQYRHIGKFPGTYFRLALDEQAQFGHKPFGYDSYGYPNASRYIRKFQSRRSVLTWKLYGQRMDGFSNDDHPSPVSNDGGAGNDKLVKAGEELDGEKFRARWDLDFVGKQMPPPDAVKAGKVAPLSDEDRRMLVRWIDLGCPIDLDHVGGDSVGDRDPNQRGYGWMLDDNRPVLTITSPQAGQNEKVDRLLIGLHDYYTGIDEDSLIITSDIAIDGVKPGDNLAGRLKSKGGGVYELKFDKPLAKAEAARLDVHVRDREGNITHIERTFSVK